MNPPLSDDVLALLRCPVTGQPLRFAAGDELQGFPGEWPEGALVAEDGSRAYPVRDGFPVLLAEEGESPPEGPSSPAPPHPRP